MSNYVYSATGENFQDWDDFDAMLKEIHEIGDPIKAQRGKKLPRTHSDYFCANAFFEELGNQAYDDCGEYAEDYMYHPPTDKVSALQELVTNWLDANFAQPSFFLVDNPQEVLLVVGNPEPEQKP